MTTPTSLPVYTQGFGTAYTGAAFVSPGAPAPTSITGPNGPFKIGQLWIDTTTQSGYILVALTSSAGTISAVWEQFSSASGFLDTLTGNTGVATPISQNINVIGASSLIQTQGSAGSLLISSTTSAYPITPFVVGPSGAAGYQTIQAAMTAAAATGGMVYVQPGRYVENLQWPTGVALCTIPPQTQSTGLEVPVQITGNHTIIQGRAGVNLWGATGILFTASTGNLFSSALTTALVTSISNCVINANAGFIFAFPSIDGSTNTSFTLQNVEVQSGGTSSTNVPGNFFLINSVLGTTGSSTLSLGSGVFSSVSSTIAEPVTNASGIFIGSYSTFQDTITSSSGNSSSVLLTDCDIQTGGSSCVIFNGTSGGTLINCTLGSTSVDVIGGNSTGTITIFPSTFLGDTTINPALTNLSIQGASVSGELITAPPISSVATGIIGNVTINTAVQNTLGYDALFTGTIRITSATAGSISMGVDFGSSPSVSTYLTSFTTATPIIVPYSANVPAGYYFALNASGTIDVDSITNVVTPI